MLSQVRAASFYLVFGVAVSSVIGQNNRNCDWSGPPEGALKRSAGRLWQFAASSSCGPGPWGAAVGRVQGVPYCNLPEEDVGRVCQILMDENCRGRVARCWDRPQLYEVASELGNDFELIPGGRRCYQKFAWNPQCFAVDELGHGRLQVLLKSSTHAEEDEGNGVGPSFLIPAHYGGLE